MAGETGRYRVADKELAKTLVEGKELHGSNYHPELVEFTALITRSYDDGKHDIVIFPPDKVPVHVHRVPERAEGEPTAGTIDIDRGYLWRPPREGSADAA